ncbi:hypothetical protein DPMN_051344 [Dreissena polymorpha]|uniref:Uncharacterized protein n=1 Tax=Dreissena polymorpha TaxID=45954 RepID=A0A9D4HNW7_DREPO|nr:hypothetical protein DPMN_051344 [Dreissena polymorpha]
MGAPVHTKSRGRRVDSTQAIYGRLRRSHCSRHSNFEEMSYEELKKIILEIKLIT